MANALVPVRRTQLQPAEIAHMRELHVAMVDHAPPRVRWATYVFVLILLVFFTWAAVSRVDEVTRGAGKVTATSGEQMIQSLEGGILAKMHVREGDRVQPGQVLIEIDPTRANAAYKEGFNKMVALQASAARLRAEAYEMPLGFPPELSRHPDIIRNETLAYNSKRLALASGVAELQRSLNLAEQEVTLTEPLVARGLLSDIEVLRMKRQVNDFRLQISEREGKYRAEANAELSRVESELSQSRENVIARADTAQRTVVRAPVRGVVKDVRISTIGGVIQPAATIMEIVPLDDRLLIEAKVRPQDVAFIHEGMPATVKITAYDFGVYGGLDGVVEHISPDTLKEDSRLAAATSGEETYYRVLVRTKEAALNFKGKSLPIMPGMTATVDIRSGQKSILDYLLKPIYKAREALQER